MFPFSGASRIGQCTTENLDYLYFRQLNQKHVMPILKLNLSSYAQLVLLILQVVIINVSTLYSTKFPPLTNIR